VQASLELRDGRSLCKRCLLAETPLRRIKGLLGREGLERGEGLLLRPASSIHTFFMRFPIDAVFLDRDLTVLRVVPHLKAWRTAGQRGAKAVLELPAGAAAQARLGPGEKLVLR
jgi:uncharacterized membrane protein (UPF0127 family)